MTADLTIRLLAPADDGNDQLDLTMRAFGPMDESRLRAEIELVVADGRCLGAFDGDRLVGTALFHDMRQWWYGCAIPMAGVAAFAATPHMLDSF